MSSKSILLIIGAILICFLSLLALYNPVNAGRYLHQHVMVAFDNIQDCFSNVCGASSFSPAHMLLSTEFIQTCPLPRNEDEAEEQRNNDTRYIRGRLRWADINLYLIDYLLYTNAFSPKVYDYKCRSTDDIWEFQSHQ
jgi:hypothetical protein